MSDKDFKKKIDELKNEVNIIKNSVPTLKLNIQQLNKDFAFISNLLNAK
jgi:hypothetical protein